MTLILEAPPVVPPETTAPIHPVEIALFTERIISTPDFIPTTVAELPIPAVVRPLVEKVVGSPEQLFGRAQDVVRAAASLGQTEPGAPPEIESEEMIMRRHAARWTNSVTSSEPRTDTEAATGEIPAISDDVLDDDPSHAALMVQLSELSLEAELEARTDPLVVHNELVAVRHQAETSPPRFNPLQRFVVGYAIARHAQVQDDARRLLVHALAGGRRTVEVAAARLDRHLRGGRLGMVVAAAQIAKLL